LLINNLCILSDLVECFKAALTKTGNLRNDLCHYDLFSQILDLKKAMRRQTFICINATIICNGWRECSL